MTSSVVIAGVLVVLAVLYAWLSVRWWMGWASVAAVGWAMWFLGVAVVFVAPMDPMPWLVAVHGVLLVGLTPWTLGISTRQLDAARRDEVVQRAIRTAARAMDTNAELVVLDLNLRVLWASRAWLSHPANAGVEIGRRISEVWPTEWDPETEPGATYLAQLARVWAGEVITDTATDIEGGRVMYQTWPVRDSGGAVQGTLSVVRRLPPTANLAEIEEEIHRLTRAGQRLRREVAAATMPRAVGKQRQPGADYSIDPAVVEALLRRLQ